jgi:hypothetical protein
VFFIGLPFGADLSFLLCKNVKVRFSRPKVGVLAHQTQGAEILAQGEYPFGLAPKLLASHTSSGRSSFLAYDFKSKDHLANYVFFFHISNNINIILAISAQV